MKTSSLVAIAAFVLLNGLVANAQTYTVPNAQVQPAWVFPLWFEDGNGARDTIYFCYDPFAGAWPFDTVMGEKIVVDPSVFNMSFDVGQMNDSMHLKVIVQDEDLLGVNIWSYNFTMPLIIRYDLNLLYSAILPYPDQTPTPTAQAQLFYDYPTATDGCYPEYPIIISDTLVGGNFCYKPDSILFSGTGLSYLLFQVVPWTGYYLSIAPSDSYSINFYPNPGSNRLVISSTKSFNRLEIHTIIGQLIYKSQTPNLSQNISAIDWQDGIYLVEIFYDDGSVVTQKWIKSNE